jgi:Ca2+-transporting ATPase
MLAAKHFRNQPEEESTAGKTTAPSLLPGTGGLTAAEAAARLKHYGPNALVEVEQHRWWTPIFHAVTDPMVLLLLASGMVYLLLQEYTDGLVLLIALLPIVAMDLLLEWRAERALSRLRALAEPVALVVRDGREQQIQSTTIVPGDLLLLQEGDVIPADGWLSEVVGLQVDESALTGESEPVAKQRAKEPLAGVRPQTESASSVVFAGTTVLTGHGRVEVTSTGKKTEYGQIGVLIAATKIDATPLQRLIARMFRVLGILAGFFCLAVVALEVLHGHGWANALLAGISLAMAAIPEEFPIVFTLYLSLGVWRMARQQALVRRLAGVETLGSTTVICSDKTGTITCGELALTYIWTPDIPEVVKMYPGSHSFTPLQQEALHAARLSFTPASRDPLDRAVAEALSFFNPPPTTELLCEYPFITHERLTGTVWRHKPDEEAQVYVKGAWERIRALLDPETPADIIEGFQQMHAVLAGQGLRVLAIARRTLQHPSGHRHQDLARLCPLGLIGFIDPVRPEVPAALAECRRAGIRVLLLTGDHPHTAAAIAREAGFGNPGEKPQAITGAQIEGASDQELATLLRTHQVFARVLPAQKYRIVQALKQQGAIVAMTGDGINDAPALKAADVGVAMGKRGTEVARAAATIVLMNDNFATIVAAVREGRRIFENLRRAFGYLIAFHLPIVLTALLVPLLGAPLFLLPIHLVWLELLVHPTSALVFQGDAPDPALMQRPPRRPTEPLMTRLDLLRVLLSGAITTTGVLVIYLLALQQGAEAPRARALAFTYLILGQVLLVLIERAPDLPLWRAFGRANSWLLPILAVTLGGLAVMLLVPGAHALAQFSTLQPGDWVVLGLVFTTTASALEFVRVLLRRRE